MANRSDGIKPFRFWCQKVLPLVYDDSLSYYETLCRVVDKLNEVIENSGTAYVDEQIEALRKELIDLIQQTSAADREYTDQEVAKAKEELGQKITELESSLTEKINQLERETNEKFEAVNDDITEVKGDITNIQGDITEINQNIENIIDGTTPVPSGHAETADKLKTARELTVDLTSNTPASFDGSANATIGVIPGGNAGDVLTSKGEGAPPAWEPPTGGGGGPSDTAKRLDPGANIQVSLASTDPALFTGASNVYPGVEGILATKNGGTGNNFTAEEYAGSLWFDQAQKVIKNAPFGEENTVLTSTGTASAPKWAPLPPGIETPVSVENGGTGKDIASLDHQGIVFYRKDTGFQVDNGSKAGNILHSAGDGGIPIWGNVNLETEVGGTLKTVNGGTGMASVPQYEIPYGDLSNPMKTTELSDDTPSVLMRQGTAFAPMWEPFDPSNPIGSAKINLANQVTGLLEPENGGTGTNLTNAQNWGVLYYDKTNNHVSSAAMGTANGVLTSNGPGKAPSFKQIDIGDISTGILPVTNGGTGTNFTTTTSFGVPYYDSSSKSMKNAVVGGAKQVLASQGAGKAPVFQNISDILPHDILSTGWEKIFATKGGDISDSSSSEVTIKSFNVTISLEMMLKYSMIKFVFNIKNFTMNDAGDNNSFALYTTSRQPIVTINGNISGLDLYREVIYYPVMATTTRYQLIPFSGRNDYGVSELTSSNPINITKFIFYKDNLTTTISGKNVWFGIYGMPYYPS